MIPSKSPYSMGWSSTWTASRLSAGSRDGPLGTAHDFNTPSSSSRRSKWRRVAACWWTMKRRPGAAATDPEGSGVRSAERLAREVLSASSGGGEAGGVGGVGGFGFTVVVHCRPKARLVAIRAAGAGWTLPRAGSNILRPSLVRSPFHHRPYARAFHWFRHDFLRARLGPDQDVFGWRVVGRDLVQLAAQEGRGPSEAAIRLLEGRGEGRERGHDQGLRVRQGPLRSVHSRRVEGARGEGDGVDQHHGIRGYRHGGPDVHGQGLLHGTRQGWRPGVHAAGRSPEEDAQGGDRAVGGARQAIPRHDPAALPGARDGAAALRQRSALDRRGADPEGRCEKGGAGHGGAARRAGGVGEVRAPEVR